MKWGFVPQDGAGPKYLCVNADEGEPGTFKDRYILRPRSPPPHRGHRSSPAYAVGIQTAFVYIRGEYETIARRLRGGHRRGPGRRLSRAEHLRHRTSTSTSSSTAAPGAYICGEETALLESLEGKRGQPRLKPPFPAVVGLFRSPTVINNVETLANVPSIIPNGADWFLGQGLPKDGGTRLFGVSGAVRRPGIYELPVGHAAPRRSSTTTPAGCTKGQTLKAVIPGGLSAPILRADEIDVPMDFDSLAAGRLDARLGGRSSSSTTGRPCSTSSQVTASFYAHESCGQCTPCRIGTSWIHKIVAPASPRAAAGRPTSTLILRLAEGIKGRTLCPLGDAAALPILAIVTKFRGELEQAVTR